MDPQTDTIGNLGLKILETMNMGGKIFAGPLCFRIVPTTGTPTIELKRVPARATLGNIH